MTPRQHHIVAYMRAKPGCFIARIVGGAFRLFHPDGYACAVWYINHKTVRALADMGIIEKRHIEPPTERLFTIEAGAGSWWLAAKGST